MFPPEGNMRKRQDPLCGKTLPEPGILADQASFVLLEDVLVHGELAAQEMEKLPLLVLREVREVVKANPEHARCRGGATK